MIKSRATKLSVSYITTEYYDIITPNLETTSLIIKGNNENFYCIKSLFTVV